MRDIALTMFTLGWIPMAFTRPVIGLLLWTWFSYMNPHRLTWGFARGFSWVYLMALITVFSLLIHPEQRQKIPWKGLTILLFTFLLWTGVTTLTAFRPALAQAQLIAFAKVQILAVVTMMLITDKQRLHWMLWVIVLSFGFWGLKSGVFTVLTGGSFHVLGPPHSFFRDNNAFALVMCMTLPLMRYLQLQVTNKWLYRGGWVLMGFTALSVLGTYSRGGLLALAAMTVMLVLKSRRRAGMIIVILLLLPVLLLLMPQKWTARMHTIDSGSQVSSLQTRINSWKYATNVALARPATGGGFMTWASRPGWAKYGPPGARRRAIHSIFFEVLGDHGFVGLGLFLALLIGAWRTFSRIKRRTQDDPDNRWMADLSAMFQVSLVGYVVAGSALPMPYLDFFYQMIALAVVMQVIMEARLKEPATQRSTMYTGVAQRPAAPALQMRQHR